MIEEMSEL